MMKRHRGFASLFSMGLVLLILTSGFLLLRVSQADSGAVLQPDRAGGKPTLHAAGRGNPWINLRDGMDLPAVYTGAVGLQQVLEQNLAQPTALASADFDEDGVPDLISSYVGPSGGIITLHRGNLYSIYPNSLRPGIRDSGFGVGHRSTNDQRLATNDDSPFLSPAQVFAVPEPPDFIGAGDFDADGHWDVVAAARGTDRLYLLRGDGQGGLGQAQQINLSGNVTTLGTGEINRRDGLDDVVVGVTGHEGSQVLVFEGPEGALKAKPEVFALPAEATALALGQLDESYEMDLAVAAGRELLIVHGRDRKLSLDAIRQADVRPATIDQQSFPFLITSLALGDFIWDREHRTEIALLSDDGTVHVVGTRDSGSGVREQLSRSSAQRQSWEVKQVFRYSQFPNTQSLTPNPHLVRAKVSSLPTDDLVILDPSNHQLHILTTDDEPRITNNHQLATSDERLVTITAESAPIAVLPMRLNVDALNDLVILRQGQTMPTVTLTAAAATYTVTNTNDSGTGSLRQAILKANASPGADMIVFSIPGAGPHTFTLLSALPDITDSITLDGTSQPGFLGKPLIELSGKNSGYTSNGLSIRVGSTTVRGLVVSGFGRNGIELWGGDGNIIEGNFIGTDVNGIADLGNGKGVSIHYGSTTRIGGTVAVARNIISGNKGDGTLLEGNQNQVQGNFIGTDIKGTSVLRNSVGITILGVNNTIGGTVAGARNIISGNRSVYSGFGVGIYISGNSAAGNLVQGNHIGIDLPGTKALGNSRNGIYLLSGSNNTIGGTAVGGANIISGNDSAAIELAGTEAVRVQGNLIGTDITGTLSLGNAIGVEIRSGRSNTIGGTRTGARNVISGNKEIGISIHGSGNQVQANLIGTQINGTSPLPNGSHGITIVGEYPSNTIGGTTTSAGNTIAFNGGDGVFVAGIGTAIQSNAIFSNAGLGIDLYPDGVTLNDPEDRDTGANGLQNFPVLTAASSSGGSTTIQGILNSKSNTTFTIEFFSNAACDPSGYGEGQNFIGSTTARTDGNGIASLNVTFSVGVATGQLITATATDPDNNTSEFSACIQVVAVAQPDIDVTPLSLNFGSVIIGQGADRTLTVSNTGSATLKVSGLSVDNSQFSFASPALPFDVSPSGQQTLSIYFTPTKVGTQTAIFRINSNDPDEATAAVALRGEGTPSRILSLPNTQGEAGRAVTIPVALSEGTGISSLEFTLSFDKTLLSLSGPQAVSLGSLVPGNFTLNANTSTPGQVTVTISAPTTHPVPTFRSGSGAVVNIDFLVAANAAAGATSPLTLSRISAFDPSPNPVPVRPQNGTFTSSRPETSLPPGPFDSITLVNGALRFTVSPTGSAFTSPVSATIKELAFPQMDLSSDGRVLTLTGNPGGNSLESQLPDGGIARVVIINGDGLRVYLVLSRRGSSVSVLPPTVTDVSPQRGSPWAQITIHGSNFSPTPDDNTIIYKTSDENEYILSATESNDRQLRALMPSILLSPDLMNFYSGPIDIRVQTATGYISNPIVVTVDPLPANPKPVGVVSREFSQELALLISQVEDVLSAKLAQQDLDLETIKRIREVAHESSNHFVGMVDAAVAGRPQVISVDLNGDGKGEEITIDKTAVEIVERLMISMDFPTRVTLLNGILSSKTRDASRFAGNDSCSGLARIEEELRRHAAEIINTIEGALRVVSQAQAALMGFAAITGYGLGGTTGAIAFLLAAEPALVLMDAAKIVLSAIEFFPTFLQVVLSRIETFPITTTIAVGAVGTFTINGIFVHALGDTIGSLLRTAYETIKLALTAKLKTVISDKELITIVKVAVSILERHFSDYFGDLKNTRLDVSPVRMPLSSLTTQVNLSPGAVVQDGELCDGILQVQGLRETSGVQFRAYSDFPRVVNESVRISDVMEVVVVGTKPLKGGFQMTSTQAARTYTEGETMQLTAPAGGTVDVTFDAGRTEQLSPGRGPFTFRWLVSRIRDEREYTNRTFTLNLNPGYYMVSLTVTDGQGQQVTAQASIWVTASNQQPVVTFTMKAGGHEARDGGSLSLLAPLGQSSDVTFSAVGSYDPDGGALNYGWLIDGRLASTAKDFTHPLGPGNHQISLTVTDDENQSKSVTATVNVIAQEPAQPFISDVSPVLANVGEFNLTINGNNFDPSIVEVVFRGPYCETDNACVARGGDILERTPSRIVAKVYIGNDGTFRIKVRNVPSGKLSNEMPLRVTRPEAQPVISVNPASLRFDVPQGSAEVAQILNIGNAGGGTLNWTASTTTSWLRLSYSNGTAPSSTTVVVNAAGLSQGLHTGEILIAAQAATNTPQRVPVTLTVAGPTPTTPPPTITSTPASVQQKTGEFTVTGSNFTPYGTVRRFVSWLGTTPQEISSITADSLGQVRWTFPPKCTDPVGDHLVWAVDVFTNRQSNREKQTITLHPGCIIEPIFRIAGRVTRNDGTAISGLQVRLFLSPGQSITVLTDSSGRYVFAQLFNGTYTVKPWTPGWNYVPAERSVTIFGADVTGIDFIATEITPLVVRAAPPSGEQGTTFYLFGENFQGNDSATLHLLDPNQRDIWNVTQPVPPNGSFQRTFQTDSSTMTGTYQFWAEDNFTRRTSSKVSFEVKKPESKPPGPFDLSVTARCSGTSAVVDLNWTTSIGATKYDVRRRITSWEVIATVFAPTHTYTDTTPPPDTTITYEIKALNDYGSRASDHQMDIRTPRCTPETGTVEVKARLDGVAWTGSVDIELFNVSQNRIVHLGPVNVPKTFSGLSPDTYRCTYNSSGGPPGSRLTAVSPSESQQLRGGETITFSLEFETQPPDPLEITTPSPLPNGATNRTYSFQLYATGGVAPYTWSATGLPNGLTIDSNGGVISGTPQQRGAFTVSVQVRDSRGTTASKNFSLTIEYPCALMIRPQSLPTGTVGVYYQQDIPADCGSERNYQWSKSGTIPPGLNFRRYDECDKEKPDGNCGAILEGTPTQAGSYTFTARVTDSDGNVAEKTFTVAINSAPTDLTIEATNMDLPIGTVGQSYSATLRASGGTRTGYTWLLVGGTTLVSGLSLLPNGIISGVPTEITTTSGKSFTVQVEDSARNKDTKTLRIYVFYADPHIDNVAPAYLVVDGQNHTITVTGTNFALTAKVRLSYSGELETTFLSSSMLQARIYAVSGFYPFSDKPSGGTGFWAADWGITVQVPGSRSVSNLAPFSIYNPPPTLSRVTAVQADGSACRRNTSCYLIVEGNGLVSDTNLLITGPGINETVGIMDVPATPQPWNRINRTSSFSVSQAGTFTLTVNNPQCVGACSVSAPFTVNP